MDESNAGGSTSTETTTSTSSPAAAAPASSGAPTTENGTMSASDALAFAESSLATPESADPTPAPAETAPAASESATTTADDPRSPMIPRARFDEINERAKRAEETLKARAWAEGISAEDGQIAVNLARAIRENPVQATMQLLQGLESDPQYAEAIRSHAAQILGRRQQQADAEPEPDLQAQDGTLVYSATQQKAWQEWNKRQMAKEFDAKLAPLNSLVERQQQAESFARATNTVTQAMQEFRTAYPEFTDAHKATVAQAIQADPRLTALTASDPYAALELAWHRVYRTEILPAQQQQSEARTVASLKQRAVMGTVNPSSAAPVTPKSTIGDARAALMAAGVD